MVIVSFVSYAVQRLFPAGLSGSAVLFVGWVARGPKQGVQEALPRATGKLQQIASGWVSFVLSYASGNCVSGGLELMLELL